ncbi:hypothetical protein EDD18DRAFT_1337993 [Armillaria luteobubalina]|uniref:Uncharacterized protein n=1 Tax=Armillaria luteobubalina TaxID=153913 RepID=A0AA39P4I8_9AGAR|nr:hypothetical protein EDD18DRAFT_1337993 [Armillaria luteobubalina]
MDTSPSPLNITTHAPISGGNMAGYDEDQARVDYPQTIDYDWESIDLSGFETFCAIPDPEYIDDLRISSSPLPVFMELGPEWTCGETATTEHAEIKHQGLRDTWYSKADDPDRGFSLSAGPVGVEPSAWYPTPPRSLSPPSAISPADTFGPERQLPPLACSSTWTSYPGVVNVPSPLTYNPYRTLMFHGVATSSTFGSSSKKTEQPQSGKVPRLHDKRPSPRRRVNPYPAFRYLHPRLSNTDVLHDSTGTHLYVPVKTVKVASCLAPIYDQNIDPAKTFFGLQRVGLSPDVLHPCPHPNCSSAFRIDDFPLHYVTEHSHWSYASCQKGSCPSFYKPHDPNGEHGPLCRRQIICIHGKDLKLLDRENVKDHILAKHLKPKHIECPHCSSALANLETLAGHLQICDKLDWARRQPKKDGRRERKTAKRDL